LLLFFFLINPAGRVQKAPKMHFCQKECDFGRFWINLMGFSANPAGFCSQFPHKLCPPQSRRRAKKKEKGKS
jgi:hypothetical protein